MQTEKDEYDLDDRVLVDLVRFRIGTGQKLIKKKSNHPNYKESWELKYTPATDALTSPGKYLKMMLRLDVSEVTDEMFPDPGVKKHENIPFDFPGVPDDAVVIFYNEKGQAPFLEMVTDLKAKDMQEMDQMLKDAKSDKRKVEAENRRQDGLSLAAKSTESPSDEEAGLRKYTEERLEAAKEKRRGENSE